MLKSWYLARLRNAVSDKTLQMTPATLISADRDMIERLILSGIESAVRVYSYRSDRYATVLKACLLITIILLLMLLGLTVAAESNSLSGFLMLVQTACIASCAAALFLLRQRLLAPLDATGNKLALSVGRDIDGLQDFVAALDDLARARNEHQSGETLIADSAPVLLVSIDQDRRVIACNRKFGEFLNCTLQEIIGSQLLDFVMPEDSATLNSGLALAKQGNPVSALDARILAKHGTAHDFRWNLDWSANAGNYFLLAEDVSDSKKLERARSEFVSTMGHDIKIPLTSVWTALQLVLKDQDHTLCARDQDLIALAEGNTERLIGLIDELLEYERTESGRMQLRDEMVSTSELTQSAVASIKSQSTAKNISINVQCDDVVFHGDESKLTRVLTNLLSNAVKFSPVQSVVHVQANVIGDHVDFKIIDQGPGIPREYQRLIFERYERLPQTENAEGTGLGLSICKSIVESHSGIIGVRSTASGGSEFWFTIPVRRPQ